jgi:hypothetical protein
MGGFYAEPEGGPQGPQPRPATGGRYGGVAPMAADPGITAVKKTLFIDLLKDVYEDPGSP